MTFQLSENQLKQFEDFKQHFYGLKYTSTPPHIPGSSGPFSVVFTPGPIGTVVEVVFNPGGQKRDITEYGGW
jgi:hypothetical protein